MKSLIYRLCLILIEAGRTDKMEEKLSRFYSMGKLSKEEFEELKLMII